MTHPKLDGSPSLRNDPSDQAARSRSSSKGTLLALLVLAVQVAHFTGHCASVAWFPFDGNLENQVRGAGTASASSPVYVPDRFGQPGKALLFTGSAENFDGSGTEITAPIDSLPAGNQDRTITFWVLPATTRYLNGVVVNWGVQEANRRFAILIPGDRNRIHVIGEGTEIKTTAPLHDNKWHHVAVTYGSGLGRIYMDGTLLIEGSISFETAPTQITLGRTVPNPFHQTEWFSGALDDLRIYNEVLSAPQVTTLYNQESIRSHPGITQQPKSSRVAIGSSHTLSVGATGSGTLAYQWRLNGTTIPGATNSFLYLPDFSPQNTGEYSVEVRDSVGIAISDVARLTAYPDRDGDGLDDDFELGQGRFALIPGSFTWEEARRDAERRGGHLATLTSESEWRLAQSILGTPVARPVWLGASDAANEGTWEWVTGEPFIYSAWGRTSAGGSQPDGSTGENYLEVHVFDSRWNDVGSNAQSPYLLEQGFPTDPNNPDTDSDGFSDGDETLVFKTNPLDRLSQPPRRLASSPGFSPTLGFRLHVFGNPGERLKILTSQDLTSWTTWTNTLIASNRVVLVDTNATDAPAFRFYRAVAVSE